jgi:hypothetical protein
MDFILLIVLCVALYKIAQQNGISPWRWIINFVVSFFVIILLMSAIAVMKFGTEVFKSEEFSKTALLLSPFVLLLEVILFLYFRKAMLRYVDHLDALDKESEDNYTPPSSNSDASEKKEAEKKDLSYFR